MKVSLNVPPARPRRRLVRLAAVTVSLVLAGALAACSDDAVPVAAEPVPNPTRTPAPPPPTSPLTGLPLEDGEVDPVLVVKLDNTSRALPHVGLTDADLVYVEQVEGGITRLAAVFSSRLPKEVLPIRSARETDAELLTQLGKVPVAFSGAVDSVHQRVQAAGLQDVSQDVGGEGYYRVSGRYAPYNLAGTPKVLLARGKKVLARDIGLRFGAVPPGGKKVRRAEATYAGARIGFVYKPSSNTWTYLLNGQTDRLPGKPAVQASTVIIQSVPVGTVRRSDSSGSSVPFMSTIGSGKARVLRDGKVFTVRWQRKRAGGPTRFTKGGVDFPLAPGQVWVVLHPQDRVPTFS